MTAVPAGTRPADTAEASTLTDADIAFIVELVRTRIAVQLEGKGYLMESRLAPVVRQHGTTDVHQLVGKLRTAPPPALLDDVLDALTTNETSFFRDQHPFTVLAEKIIPEILASTGGQGPLTIWNGACSSGQEALSIAMVIHDKFPVIAKPGRTRIISTDVSSAMVRRSTDGIYSRFEVNRGLPASYATRFFTQAGRNWQAKKELLDLIEVRQMNLIQPWKMIPKCDLVLLRNVLIYFPTSTKQDILRRIRTDVLKPKGCLLLGSSESTHGIDPNYEVERVSGSTIFLPKGHP